MYLKQEFSGLLSWFLIPVILCGNRENTSFILMYLKLSVRCLTTYILEANWESKREARHSFFSSDLNSQKD